MIVPPTPDAGTSCRHPFAGRAGGATARRGQRRQVGRGQLRQRPSAQRGVAQLQQPGQQPELPALRGDVAELVEGQQRPAGGGPGQAGALRDLVSTIEDEVTAITALSGQIDEHVEALNGLRAEATRRLLHLDALSATAEDVNLSAFLDTTIQPQLPQSEEEFPERIYGG